MNKIFGDLSNTFYRLARKDKDGTYTIYDFHTAVRTKYRWYQEHDRVILVDGKAIGDYCHYPKSKEITVEWGNKFYKRLKSQGFKFVGKFEEDIYGYQRKMEDR